MNNFFKTLSAFAGFTLVLAFPLTLTAQTSWNLVHGHAKVDIFEKTDVVCPNTAAGLDLQYTLLKIVNKIKLCPGDDPSIVTKKETTYS
jgi:hypothetical protein